MKHFNQTHGHTVGGRSPTYVTWKGMMNRAHNNCRHHHKSVYEGVQVCTRWTTFENFLEDMGERPPGTSLDRIDGRGDYTLDNCRWADRPTQNRNKKTPKNNTSGRKGVYFDKTSKVWTASIHVEGKNKHLGRFVDKADAVLARVKAEKEYW